MSHLPLSQAASYSIEGQTAQNENTTLTPGLTRGETGTLGQVDHAANGFDPSVMLSGWDYGQVRTLPSGQTLSEFHVGAVDKETEVAPGVFFPA